MAYPGLITTGGTIAWHRAEGADLLDVGLDGPSVLAGAGAGPEDLRQVFARIGDRRPGPPDRDIPR